MNPSYKPKFLMYLLCLKEKKNQNVCFKVPKFVNFEIFKMIYQPIILQQLHDFITMKTSKGETALMIARNETVILFLTSIQEAINQGYDAVVEFMKKTEKK